MMESRPEKQERGKDQQPRCSRHRAAGLAGRSGEFRSPFTRLAGAALLVVALFLAGCAKTTVETTGIPLTEPLCTAEAPPLPVFVSWGTQWRPDQKEPAVREALAQRGIEEFLASVPCLAVTGVQRLPAETGIPADEALLRMVRTAAPRAERAVLVVVRELGPRLLIGLPGIVEGGTEVRIDVRVLRTATSESLANAHTLWRHGGPLVIKGIDSLDRDLSAALSATLMPAAPVP